MADPASMGASVQDDQLQRDMNALQEGIRLLFTNDFQKAEETFREGSQRERPRIRPANDSTRDTRGVFALIYTMVSFMFGLLSFANDQLDECLTRVWTAESLLLEDAPWVGQKMLLGMVYLIAGVVQAAKNAWLKSGVNLVRSLRYIKDFEEGLHFSGREAHFVRSFAGFVMGLFNLVLSMLPPQMLRVASRAGGRTLQGSRTDALELLHQCYVQDGIMAPFAVLVLLCYNIWIKTYLGEAITDEDFAASKGFLQWASERYPSSAVFEFWQAELHVIRTEVREASECVERVHSVLAHLKLPAIDSFLEQKKAMFSLALLEWPEAASGFEESLAVSVARQRRSYVPTLSYLAGLCRVVSGQAAEARPNFERVQQYSKMRKRNWPPEDDLAFAKVKEFGPSSCTTPRRALLELVEISMLKIHVLHTMPGEEKRRLKEKLLEEHEGEAAEEAARGLLFAAEISRLQGAFEVQSNGRCFSPGRHAMGSPDSESEKSWKSEDADPRGMGTVLPSCAQKKLNGHSRLEPVRNAYNGRDPYLPPDGGGKAEGKGAQSRRHPWQEGWEASTSDFCQMRAPIEPPERDRWARSAPNGFLPAPLVPAPPEPTAVPKAAPPMPPPEEDHPDEDLRPEHRRIFQPLLPSKSAPAPVEAARRPSRFTHAGSTAGEGASGSAGARETEWSATEDPLGYLDYKSRMRQINDGSFPIDAVEVALVAPMASTPGFLPCAVEDILLLLFVSNDNALVQRLDSNAKRGWLPLRNLRPLGPYDFLVKAFVDTGRPKLQKSSERPPSDILPLPQMEGSCDDFKVLQCEDGLQDHFTFREGRNVGLVAEPITLGPTTSALMVLAENSTLGKWNSFCRKYFARDQLLPGDLIIEANRNQGSELMQHTLRHDVHMLELHVVRCALHLDPRQSLADQLAQLGLDQGDGATAQSMDMGDTGGAYAEEARRFGAQAQQLLPKLGPRGQSNGTAAALHLTLALLGVDGHLTALDKCPRCCRAYDEAIKFKRPDSFLPGQGDRWPWEE
ncbi:unnamed protein product [Durusdinium trenchii]|uniref:Uncharacterized protein n=1 Tax=Durusdinium trenchii TaxID=1381693 RepID=A0ABP0JBT9_9DINO